MPQQVPPIIHGCRFSRLSLVEATKWDLPCSITIMSADSKYSGMTVNDRLRRAGIMDAWDAEAISRDRDQMIELLGQIDLRNQAGKIVDTILADPRRYGFWGRPFRFCEAPLDR